MKIILIPLLLYPVHGYTKNKISFVEINSFIQVSLIHCDFKAILPTSDGKSWKKKIK
jgi:hypothetical protein